MARLITIAFLGEKVSEIDTFASHIAGIIC
jgi:hypothetical protein